MLTYNVPPAPCGDVERAPYQRILHQSHTADVAEW